MLVFFFSSRRRHTRCSRDWSSDVCSSDLVSKAVGPARDAVVVLVVGIGVGKDDGLGYRVQQAPPEYDGGRAPGPRRGRRGERLRIDPQGLLQRRRSVLLDDEPPFLDQGIAHAVLERG